MFINEITTKGAITTMKFSSGFGSKEPFREHKHNGIDLPFEVGTELRTLMDGVVYAVRDYKGENIGKGVIIKTDDGNYHIFGHMSEVNVTKGERLQAGDFIGLSGNTGNVVGDGHLHFGIQKPNGEFINPEKYGDALVKISGDAEPVEIVHAISSVNDNWLDNVKNFVGDAEPLFRFGDESNSHIFWEWVWSKIVSGSIHLWDLFVLHLPDIMGYTTICAAAILVLSSMIGKGGMLKTLGWWFGAFILAVTVLNGS